MTVIYWSHQSCRLALADVVEGSVIHMVMRPVDTSQQPPPPGPQEHMAAGGMGRFAVPMMGSQGPGAPMDPNEFGSVRGGPCGVCCHASCKAHVPFETNISVVATDY